MKQQPDASGEFPIVMAHAGSMGWDHGDSWKVAGSLEEACRGARSP